MKKITAAGCAALCAGLAVSCAGGAQRGVSSGSAVFVSAGPSETGTTYYVNAETGSDAGSGTSPQTAWKTLKKVNSTVFSPGDHILLYAGSVWNGLWTDAGGAPLPAEGRARDGVWQWEVTAENVFYTGDGFLWPKGSGTAGKPIVIDFYDLAGGKAVYTSARRPVINGNGTPAFSVSEPPADASILGTGYQYQPSGAVTIYDGEYWEINNLEITNSFDAADADAYKWDAKKQLCGILIYGVSQERQFNHIVIKNNYIHDVQTEYYNDHASAGDHGAAGFEKCTGGIIVMGHTVDKYANYIAGIDPANAQSRAGYDDVLIEDNHLERVGLEGIRTVCKGPGGYGYKQFTNVVIRGNFLEYIAGDGIVMSQVSEGGLVEHNVIMRACDADLGKHNYAGCWAWYSDNCVFQYNEVYGTRYGYNDGEAFDVDLGCDRTIYQYNYSHHNAGGFMLIMDDQTNTTVRYNVSVNDGFGNNDAWGNAVHGADRNKPVDWETVQQTLFHYWQNAGSSPIQIPLIYNNTFYVGDSMSAAVFGGEVGQNDNLIVQFHNNIILKEGAGKVTLAGRYDGEEKVIANLAEGGFRNNIIWPAGILTEKTGVSRQALEGFGNIFADPRLILEEAASWQTFIAGENTAFPARADTAEFRSRISPFALQEGSPAASPAGIPVPVVNRVRRTAATIAPAKTDIFGLSVPPEAPGIGAAYLAGRSGAAR